MTKWEKGVLRRLKLYSINTHGSVQFSSVAQSCATLFDPMNCSTPGLPVHHQLPEFTQTHVHRVSDAIQPSHPVSSPSAPAPNPSQHQGLFQWAVFISGGQSIEVSASTSVLPVNIQESFRMDWLDLLAVQGTLKSLLQHHSSKASVLRHSAFFTDQLSHPYVTTGKTIALTRQSFGRFIFVQNYRLYTPTLQESWRPWKGLYQLSQCVDQR